MFWSSSPMIMYFASFIIAMNIIAIIGSIYKYKTQSVRRFSNK